MDDFLTNLGGSRQFDVNTTYYDSQGSITGNLSNPLIVTDNLSQGASLGSSSIPKIVQAAITNGLAADFRGRLAGTVGGRGTSRVDVGVLS